MSKPTTYPPLSQVTDGTEIYSQRPSAGATPKNFRFSALKLYQYILGKLESFSTGPARVTPLSTSSGATFVIPSLFPLPDASSKIQVYRDGMLIPWGRGVTRNGNTLTFIPELDDEFIEVIIHR